jgi:CheY-like chemotaxis protein
MHIKLHHELENQIRSANAENRLKNINLIHELEQSRKEVFLCGLRNIKLQEEKNSLENRAESEFADKEAKGLTDQNDNEQIEQFDYLDNIEDEEDDFVLPPVGTALTYRSQKGYAVEKRILAVEDDPDVAEFLINALEINGYPVIVSSSVSQAREIVLSPEENIGCVFADIQLPDGSGIDLIKAIRKNDQNMPILVGSGFPLSDKNRQFLDENRITFIKKPYHINSLILNFITLLPSED